MKRFLKFYQKDKLNIKMINQSEKGFELIILDNNTLKELLEIINMCEEENDELSIVWQMKHKKMNFIVYKKCVFSAPMDNFIKDKLFGKKLKVSCTGTSFYSDSYLYKDRVVKKSKDKYKDATLLTRMLKISELNLKSCEHDENINT